MKWSKNRLALILAVAHLGLVFLVAGSIAAGEDPVAWFVFLILDFPVSLVWMAIHSLESALPSRPHGSILLDPWNFLVPLGFLSVVGTAWWYLLGVKIQRWRSKRPPGTSWWSHNVS